MKLLLYMPGMTSGGAERVAANLANHWAGRGWQVTLVSVTSADQDAYALHPAVRRVALHLQSDSGNALRGLANNLRRAGALRRLLGEVRPRIALSMMPSANVVLALASVGLKEVGTVGSERSHPAQEPLGAVWGFLRARAYGRLGAIVALSEQSADWLRRHTSARRVEVIPNPVQLPLKPHPPTLPIPERPRGTRVLLAAGRLSQEKGFDVLIDVFARLAPGHAAWILVILGDGPLRGALEQRAREQGVSARVHLPGRAGNVAEWYASADLFVLSSRLEGFPNVLVEAMAHGLPAVSFDCETGPRTIIRTDIDGVLVPPGDAAALEAELARLMEDDALRARLAQRAPEVRERFSMENTAARWERLFGQLTGET